MESMTNDRVLIVAAHPDDEVLGCGGVAARHVAEGDAVAMFIVAEGATSRDKERDPVRRASEIEALRQAARSSAQALGVTDVRFAGLPDNRLDSIDLLDLVKIVESAVTDFDPSVVYTHHGSDLNIDHRLLHQAVCTACRPLPDSNVRAIYAFETASSTEFGTRGTGPAFEPVHFVDITDYWPAKELALHEYESEMRAYPHARSIEAVKALGKWRGASAGLQVAEAFEVIWEVVVKRR